MEKTEANLNQYTEQPQQPPLQKNPGRRRHGHDNLGIAMEPTMLNLHENTVEKEEESSYFDFFGLWLIALQVVFITLFFVFGRYTDFGDPDNSVVVYYQFMRDVGVMVLVGFGFLMTFLKRHRFSSIGYTFFIAVIVVEWSILVNGFYTWVLDQQGVSNIKIGFPQLILGLFAAATVLVSFGVWIGKIGPEQLLFMALFEVMVYATNAYICEGLLHLRDVGGTMIIHMFGAYFGLAAGKFVSPTDTRDRALYAGSSYTSDTFSMIGTLFLWLFWPSFNSALVPTIRQHYSLYNTFLSLCGSAFFTFAFSRILRRERHFTMEDLQNATIAGGVAMGASADIIFTPAVALLIGSLAGALSVFGFSIIGPFIQRKLKIYDTCGVHNLHGMPAILGGIASSIVASQVGGNLLIADFHHGTLQWGYQLAAVAITLGMSIAGGIVVGIMVKYLPIPKPKGVQLFDDTEYFELPDVFEAGVGPVETDVELQTMHPVAVNPNLGGDEHVERQFESSTINL